MKLTQDQAYDLTCCPSIPELPGIEVEANEYIGSGRWESYHQLVLRDQEGRFWSATYSLGLTERQDIRPFEFDGEQIEFTQVEKVPVITYEYREVKPGEGGVSEPAGDSPDSPAPGESRVPGGSDDYLPAADAGDYPSIAWPALEPGVIYEAGDSFKLWMGPDGTWHSETVRPVPENSEP